MSVNLLVADSGPLIALAIANLLPTLKKQYQALIVPEAVLDECLLHTTEPGTQQIQAALELGHIKIVPTAALETLEVGAGEAAVIHYAKAHKLTALIDDKRAIAVAKRLAVTVVRSGAILVDLKRRGAIPAIKPVLDGWQEHGYFLAEAVRSALLAQAGEL